MNPGREQKANRVKEVEAAVPELRSVVLLEITHGDPKGLAPSFLCRGIFFKPWAHRIALAKACDLTCPRTPSRLSRSYSEERAGT
jgi:hypothetical protein